MTLRFLAGLYSMIAVIVLPAAAFARPPAPRPNIIIIFTDDLGYGDIGPFGAEHISTPHLDAMAADGMKLTDFYVSNSVCTPSRAALITGRYPVRHGLTSVVFPDSRVGLPQSEVTLAELVAPQGYATAWFGKWHLGHLPQFLPTSQGFDVFKGAPFSNDMEVYAWYEGETIVDTDPDQRFLTRRITDDLISFIEAQDGEPFLAVAAHPMPHVPLFASPDFEGSSDGGLYGDVIEELDASVGELRAALERSGIADNTMILFTSDNGPWLDYADHAGSTGGLREGKFTIFEGGMRVPTLAVWRGTIPAGSTYSGIGSTLDLFPTIAGWTGAALPDDREIDGIDIRPAFEQGHNPDPDRAYPYYRWGSIGAIRQGDWKLVLPGTGWQQDLVALDWPGAHADYGEALYNLSDDPGETRDLSADHPQIVARLKARIAEIEASVGPPADLGAPFRNEALGITPDLAGTSAPDNPSRTYRDRALEQRRQEAGIGD